ncbi:MAG: hypothetical protein Q4G04_04735 [bacterium]|nr:hypothetical protein [bacterium]
MKKKKRKRKIIIFSIILIFLIGITYYFFNKNNNYKEVKVISNIEGYNYTLENNKTALYQDLFYQLKNILETETVNEEEYAILISKMFASDFYDLNSKISKNDIGGLQFIYPDKIDTFVTKAQDTIYAYVNSNIYNNRNQELPIVSNVEASIENNTTFKYDTITDNKAINTVVNITYQKDLKYPSTINLTLIHSDKYLYIAEIN